jgi:hypothetical protein
VPVLNGRLPDGGVAVLPCHAMSRGGSTFTESRRGIASFSDTCGRAALPAFPQFGEVGPQRR